MNNWRRNSIERIAKKCEEKEVTVSKDFVSYLLTLVELIPACRIDEDEDESKMENAIRCVVEKLIDRSSPSLVTLKIQLYFAKHYNSRDEIVKKHRLRLRKKTGPLVAEICTMKGLENDRDVERLYQKILVVITLLSGLGNPMVAPVLKEVAVALQSIFQPSELAHYVTLSKEEKEKQLMELVSIVAGIRIFNRDCQRGGEGIDDLPRILHDSVAKTRDSVVELLEDLMRTVYRLTSAIEGLIFAKDKDRDEKEDSERSDDAEYSRDATNDDFDWAVELLAACRQQEIYIRKLLCDLELCEDEIKQLMERLQARLFKIHDTVRYRTAIPTVQVYPQFIDLADVWMGLQDEVIVLGQLYHFFWQLRALCTKNVNVYDHTRLDSLLRDREVLTDAERLEQSMGRLITDGGQCAIYYPNNSKDFDNIHIQLLGFCAWSFIAGRGSLIPGNPNIGILKWRGKYFAFSSGPAAQQFGEDPSRHAYDVLDLVRQRYEYVHLFQVYDDVAAMKSPEETTDEVCHTKIHQDQGIQTDLHMPPSHVDRSYSHSVWEYRRRALKLATIVQCSTRSTQTANSHFRSGVYVQAASPTDRAAQTRRDGQANTAKRKNFIFGLRGRRDATQHVLSLVDEETAPF